jgi:hypothetical protein
MISWNLISNDEKLSLWKNLRNSIGAFTYLSQLPVIATFFANVPFGSRSIDYYTPSTWPTPWEILFYSTFCTSSISLLIFYTLTLTFKDVNIEIYLVEDDTGVYLLPIVDNKFILNYELGQISIYQAIQEKIKVLKVYSISDIKSIK